MPKTAHAQCASLIRKDLRKLFKGIRFKVSSIEFTSGATVSVYWTDGPTEADVHNIVLKNCSTVQMSLAANQIVICREISDDFFIMADEILDLPDLRGKSLNYFCPKTKLTKRQLLLKHIKNMAA